MTMWPRYCEAVMAVWLIVSGWVVDYPDLALYRLISIGAGILILILDLLSVLLSKRLVYLLIAVVAGGLLGFSFRIAPAEAQGTQNLLVVGLLLLMFALLPTEATRPPESWRRLHRVD